MMYLIDRALWWRISVTFLLIFDYFLFSTGNPSITYSFLGGWFQVTLLLTIAIALSIGYKAFAIGGSKRDFVVYAISVALLSFALVLAGPYARHLACARLQAKVVSFVDDPVNSRAEVSRDDRQRMIEIKKQEFNAQLDAFIPTFRRMDYILRTGHGEKYLLVMEVSWKGTPVISLRRVPT